MSNILVCIPTLTGRERYLANCLKGYRERSGAHHVLFSIVYNAPTCGIGWQQCVNKGLVVRGFDYIHFGNDDSVVGENWLSPLIAAAGVYDRIPASRVEPAGVHLGHPMPDPIPMPPPGDPTSQYGYFYSDLLENQPTEDWQEVDHGGAPFCSLKQWAEIGPMIPSHFGTDKWFFHRARQLGYKVVARQRSIIYNYAAPIGRSKGEWTEQDFLDFDLTIAYPMYVSGELSPTEQHPQRLTSEGLERVREWRRVNFG